MGGPARGRRSRPDFARSLGQTRLRFLDQTKFRKVSRQCRVAEVMKQIISERIQSSYVSSVGGSRHQVYMKCGACSQNVLKSV